MNSSARFSEDRLHRYELWRRWADGPYCQFIGLNPSTADETLDDPTIRRCIRFAQDWGYSALCMTNIFAFRATDPMDMKKATDPIGPDNDRTLLNVAADAGIVIAAWGVHGEHLRRGKEVRRLQWSLHHLGLTKDGHPKHPLYLRADTKPTLWESRA